jgi:ABC-type multidrug transport system ATPase subunit
MEIFLEELGKRYRREWIFRDLNFQASGPEAVAVLGPNGAGKSTLIRIAAGLALPSVGRLGLRQGGTEYRDEEHTARCAFTAPYLELPEELSLRQLLRFHFRFRPLLQGLDPGELPALLDLERFRDHAVQQYSSGMKQRVKLGLTLFTDVPFLFLDEPLTNLDSAGGHWYQELIRNYRRDRFIMVASNRPEEYSFCTRTLQLADHKPRRAERG